MMACKLSRRSVDNWCIAGGACGERECSCVYSCTHDLQSSAFSSAQSSSPYASPPQSPHAYPHTSPSSAVITQSNAIEHFSKSKGAGQDRLDSEMSAAFTTQRSQTSKQTTRKSHEEQTIGSENHFSVGQHTDHTLVSDDCQHRKQHVENNSKSQQLYCNHVDTIPSPSELPQDNRTVLLNADSCQFSDNSRAGNQHQILCNKLASSCTSVPEPSSSNLVDDCVEDRVTHASDSRLLDVATAHLPSQTELPAKPIDPVKMLCFQQMPHCSKNLSGYTATRNIAEDFRDTSESIPVMRLSETDSMTTPAGLSFMSPDATDNTASLTDPRNDDVITYDHPTTQLTNNIILNPKNTVTNVPVKYNSNNNTKNCNDKNAGSKPTAATSYQDKHSRPTRRYTTKHGKQQHMQNGVAALHTRTSTEADAQLTNFSSDTQYCTDQTYSTVEMPATRSNQSTQFNVNARVCDADLWRNSLPGTGDQPSLSSPPYAGGPSTAGPITPAAISPTDTAHRVIKKHKEVSLISTELVSKHILILNYLRICFCMSYSIIADIIFISFL